MLTHLLRDDQECIWNHESFTDTLMLISLFPNLMHSFISFSPLRAVRKIGVISRDVYTSKYSWQGGGNKIGLGPVWGKK